jgi:hypothetical protein
VTAYIFNGGASSAFTQVAGMDAQPDRAGGVSVMVGWNLSGYSTEIFSIL